MCELYVIVLFFLNIAIKKPEQQLYWFVLHRQHSKSNFLYVIFNSSQHKHSHLSIKAGKNVLKLEKVEWEEVKWRLVVFWNEVRCLSGTTWTTSSNWVSTAMHLRCTRRVPWARTGADTWSRALTDTRTGWTGGPSSTGDGGSPGPPSSVSLSPLCRSAASDLLSVYTRAKRTTSKLFNYFQRTAVAPSFPFSHT